MSATTANTNPDVAIEDDNIMGSIATLRKIVMGDHSSGIGLDGDSTLSPLETLQTELSKSQAELASVQEALTQEKQLRRSLETTYQALQKHKNEVSLQLQLASRAKQSLEDRLDQRVKSWEAERASMLRQRCEWQQELESWKRQARDYGKQVEDYKQQLEKVKLELEQERNKEIPPALEDRIRESVSNLSRARKRSEDAMQALQRVEQAAKDKDAYENLRKQDQEVITSLQKENARLTIELEGARTARDKAKLGLATHREQWRDLQDDLRESKDALEGRERQIQELNVVVDELSSHVTSVRKRPAEEIGGDDDGDDEKEFVHLEDEGHFEDDDHSEDDKERAKRFKGDGPHDPHDVVV